MSFVQKKIQNFLITNPLLRRIRIFFSNFVRPILVKGIGGLIALIFVAVIALKIFKPDILQKIYADLRHGFFAQLNTKYSETLKIEVSGNQRVSSDEVKKVILESSKDQPEFYIQNLIDNIKTKLPWVHQIKITRSLPNQLNVTIVEFVPFAVWQNDGAKYLTNRDGDTVPYENSEEFSDLVILSGKGANAHSRSLFNIFVIDPELSKNVFSATWVGDRRWDLRFENGLLVKLPEARIAEAWQRLIKINNTPGSLTGLKIIDLRIPDKVYLEYNDSVIKELKNI